jgi:hypothetical protein
MGRNAAEHLVDHVVSLSGEDVDEVEIAGYVHGFVLAAIGGGAFDFPSKDGGADYLAQFGRGWVCGRDLQQFEDVEAEKHED